MLLGTRKEKNTRKAAVLYVNGNFKKKGDQQFTMEGRNAEITVDPVLQARAKMSDNKVHGPEDTVVSEMIKQLPMEKIYTMTRCFQERFMARWRRQVRGRL